MSVELILSIPSISIEGRQTPELNFLTGHSYIIFSPIDDFFQKVCPNQIIFDDFLDEYDFVNNLKDLQEMSLGKFLDQYDTKNICSILLNFERDYPLRLDSKLNHLNLYDRKCINFFYLIINTERRIIFTHPYAISLKSYYRILSTSNIISKALNLTIIVEKSGGIITNNKEYYIPNFAIYDINDLVIRSSSDYDTFWMNHLALLS